LRMREHCDNAREVARWLETHPRVSRVHYPGLPSHPQHTLAKALFENHQYGGVVSFDIEGAGREEVFRFFDALNLCVPATSLGDVHSLLLYPAHASHRTLSAEERQRMGIGAGLVRMSVGIEAVDDLLADLEQALNTLS
ncbi:MAG: PLP-dependent transferase, partial [Anaerolineae bacterium]|nr:PLP-dependent transferase [Anaerolineae bacterium]